MASEIWIPHSPVWEIVLRSLVVFFSLLILLRISGKRDVGEMSPADLVLLLLLSANVHTSLSGSDKSLTGGLIGAIALMATNHLLNRYAYRHKKFEKVLKGHPELIIHRGKPCENIMKKHHLSLMQLMVAVRKEGVSNLDDVQAGILEPDGTISIITKAGPEEIQLN